jgi:DNA-binding IclR family transcriptional regulator
MGITELSDALGIYKSTVFRTLKTLEDRGFIKQNPENGKYWFGMKMYAIGMLVGEKLHLKQVISPYTKALCDRCNEVVNVSILETVPGDFHKSIIIHKEYSTKQILSVNPPIGSASLCYCAAVGKCLLAFSKDLDFSIYEQKPMPKFTEHTITDARSLLHNLEEIRRNGYAIDDGELEIGLTCIGAPIFDKNGTVLAAISISGPTTRIKGKMKETVDMIIETAHTIEKAFR